MAAVVRALEAIEGALGGAPVAVRPVQELGAQELSASAGGRSVRAWGARSWAVVALRADGQHPECVYPNVHTARHQLALKTRAGPAAPRPRSPADPA